MGLGVAVLAAAALISSQGVRASTPVSGPLGPSPETAPPLGVVQAQPPLVMLTVGRDRTLYNEAYNDASDIDGDGVLDLRFNPRITYLGLFDSRLCYSYTPGTTDADQRRNDNAGLFQPAALAVVDTGNRNLRCADAAHWSGNWLNWATTSRIDALRVVLYGGMREVDTATQTILRRTYIPQDAHSWAKEYTSVAVDGYDIRDFTPLGLPSGTGTRRHFFGNLTDVHGRNCTNLNDCSNRAPLLRVIENSDRRVWQWASTERPVLHETSNHNGVRTDHTVRVEVCTASFNQGCRRYPNGSLKPIGLLHEFGENDAMLFGLLTGSYDHNLSGGVLRKVVSSFRDEVNHATDGTFTANARIVQTLNALRIRGFNDGRTDNAYGGGWVTTRPMNEGEFVDWGNPIAEMIYEAVRYFAGRSSPTPAFLHPTGPVDAHLGLPRATWDDPFNLTNSAARARWCARPNMLVISNINPTFDSNQLPGSAFGSFSADLPSLPALHVADIGQYIATHEPGVVGSRFIGQVGSQSDGAPTAKSVTSLGNIRGLAPNDPTMQGSFYSASVAHYARRTDLRPTLRGDQTVDTFVVALSAPLPQIMVPTTNGRSFSLVPFAKSVGGASISNVKGQFQPTNQIVDFYVESIANSCPQAAGGVASMCADYNSAINGGRYRAVFRINFEDVEQGADHDMDAIVRYEISLQADGTLRVIVTPEFQAGGIQHAMGYVLSGSTADGV
jgi:type IV pilus assembly protein PilY1